MICLLTTPLPEEMVGADARDVLIMVNNSHEPHPFIVPPVAKSTPWRLVIDTAAPSPRDAFPDGDGPPLPRSGSFRMTQRSLRCYLAGEAIEKHARELRG